MEEEIKRFKSVLKELDDMDAWVYPQSFEGKFEKRDDFMNGWNQGVMDISDRVWRIIEKVRDLIPE